MDRDRIAARLRDYGTALVTDTLLRLGTGGWMDGVHPLRSEARAAGTARTVLFGPKGGAMAAGKGFYELIESFSEGDVLVIAAGHADASLIGDNVVTWAQAHGLAAIVTDGRVRDAAVMRDLDIPVFARGTTARPPLAIEPVAFDVPVVCGGATVRQGDIVVGDGDGLVVVPPAAIADLIDEIARVEAVEKAVAEAIAERRPGAAIQELVKKKKTRGGRL